MSLYDGWDGLYLCQVCGDRETQHRVCWACREQEAIDNSDYPHYTCPVCHTTNIMALNDSFTHFQCWSCGTQWHQPKEEK